MRLFAKFVHYFISKTKISMFITKKTTIFSFYMPHQQCFFAYLSQNPLLDSAAEPPP